MYVISSPVSKTPSVWRQHSPHFWHSNLNPTFTGINFGIFVWSMLSPLSIIVPFEDDLEELLLGVHADPFIDHSRCVLGRIGSGEPFGGTTRGWKILEERNLPASLLALPWHDNQ